MKNYKLMNNYLDQVNIIALVVQDISNPNKHSMFINQPKNTKECKKECQKNHILINKPIKQENDSIFYF